MTHPGRLLKQANLYAGKELGQNFLSDPGTAKKIVEKTGISSETQILEIGAGLGALTIPIARAASRVVAVEKDSRLVGLLLNELEQRHLNHVQVMNSDILKVDIRGITGGRQWVVIGNLPYNISSQILLKLIENKTYIKKAYLMFQKELAERITALPGKRDYSRLSVVAQYASRVSRVADIGPSAFFPRPEVDSSILEFEFFTESEFSEKQEKLLFRVIKAAFSKRRKTLRNSLVHPELGFDKKAVSGILQTAGIDPGRRAETLGVSEFKRLTRIVLTEIEDG